MLRCCLTLVFILVTCLHSIYGFLKRGILLKKRNLMHIFKTAIMTFPISFLEMQKVKRAYGANRVHIYEAVPFSVLYSIYYSIET